MLIIVGFVVVLGAVIGGYLMAGGALRVLNQPSEFVVIGGAAIGSLLVSTPATRADARGGADQGALLGSGATRKDYVDLLAMLYQIFKQVQQSGVMSLEPHFEDPAQEPDAGELSRSSWPGTTRSTSWPTRSRSSSSAASRPHDLEALMDEDLHVHHETALKPAAALTKIGDALPGLGIVAAVLGVVITMGHIDGAAGGDRPPRRRGAGRHLPRHSAVVRLRASRSPAQPRAARVRGRATTACASRPACSPSTRATRRRLPSSSRAACCRTTCARRSTRPSSSAARRGKREAARPG